MNDIYHSGSYHERNQSWHSEDSPWKARQIANLLFRNHVTPQSIADVGCGAGLVLLELSTHFPNCKMFGFDVSPNLNSFWSKLPPRIRCTNDDFANSRDSYDLILCIDVFEHVRDYMGFLDSLRSRASHHVFHIPLELSVQGLLRDVPMRTRRAVGHLHYFTKSTALATLDDCGYEIVDWAYTPAALDRPASGAARILNVVRPLIFWASNDIATKLIGGWSLVVLAKPK